MSQVLIVSGPKDRLALRVGDLLPTAIRLSEHELFSSAGLAVFQEGTSVSGFLSLSSATIPLDSLAGVLYRPGQRWRPPANLRPRLRVFVKHEMQAAWCSLLNALPCPVLNRVPPEWWCDASHHDQLLARTFADRLDFAYREEHQELGHEKLLLNDVRINISTVYLVGTDIVLGEPIKSGLKAQLGAKTKEIACWQEESGVRLARIDFCDSAQGPAVARLDAKPMLGRSRALLDVVAQRVAAMLVGSP